MNFALLSMSREVSYSAMGCTFLDDFVHGHRNNNISGNGLVALRFWMFFQNFGSQIHRELYLSFFSPCSVWHTTQKLSQLLSILTACKCDYYIAHTCYLHRWVWIWITGASHAWTAIISHNFDRMAIILSSPFLTSVQNFIKLDWIFFVLFECKQKK